MLRIFSVIYFQTLSTEKGENMSLRSYTEHTIISANILLYITERNVTFGSNII
jgi:hypothetical protein